MNQFGEIIIFTMKLLETEHRSSAK